MRLYTCLHSPNPLKVRWALAELALDYEAFEVDLFKGQQKREEFVAINPMGQVPVLQQGDLYLRESNAIVCYLGRNYGKSAWPRRADLEARAYQWLFFESYSLAHHLGELWFNETVCPLIGKKPSLERIEKAARDIREPLSVVERHLQEFPYFIEEDFSLVDCVLGTTLALWRGTRAQDDDLFPAIASYLKRMQHRKGWGEANGEAIFDLGAMRPVDPLAAIPPSLDA